MTENEWEVKVECPNCGCSTWHRVWEEQRTEGVYLVCSECKQIYTIPHVIGNDGLHWSFLIVVAEEDLMGTCDGCNKIFKKVDLREAVENLFHTTKYRHYCSKCFKKYA